MPDNCGIGAGGFESGNKCASGGKGGGASPKRKKTTQELMAELEAKKKATAESKGNLASAEHSKNKAFDTLVHLLGKKEQHKTISDLERKIAEGKSRVSDLNASTKKIDRKLAAEDRKADRS